MSFVGKFFVVMQILLSVTFMGFAVTVFTYQTDFKAMAEQEAKAKQQTQAQLQNLQSEFDKFRTDNTTVLNETKGRAERAESARNGLQRQLTASQNESQRLANELTSQTSLAEIAEVESEDRRTEAMTQRVLNKDLHEKLSSKSSELLTTGDKLYNLKVVRDSLVKKNNDLAKQMAFLKTVVRDNKLETDPKIYKARKDPPPKLDGIVLKTDRNKKGLVDLVEISLGSDDGLVKGHRLSIFRSGLQPGEAAKYLGEIELVYVDSDQAVGTIIEKAKSGIIKRGDNVTSKL